MQKVSGSAYTKTNKMILQNGADTNGRVSLDCKRKRPQQSLAKVFDSHPNHDKYTRTTQKSISESKYSIKSQTSSIDSSKNHTSGFDKHDDNIDVPIKEPQKNRLDAPLSTFLKSLANGNRKIPYPSEILDLNENSLNERQHSRMKENCRKATNTPTPSSNFTSTQHITYHPILGEIYLTVPHKRELNDIGENSGNMEKSFCSLDKFLSFSTVNGNNSKKKGVTAPRFSKASPSHPNNPSLSNGEAVSLDFTKYGNKRRNKKGNAHYRMGDGIQIPLSALCFPTNDICHTNNQHSETPKLNNNKNDMNELYLSDSSSDTYKAAQESFKTQSDKSKHDNKHRTKKRSSGNDYDDDNHDNFCKILGTVKIVAEQGATIREEYDIDESDFVLGKLVLGDIREFIEEMWLPPPPPDEDDDSDDDECIGVMRYRIRLAAKDVSNFRSTCSIDEWHEATGKIEENKYFYGWISDRGRLASEKYMIASKKSR
eukprot:9030552-Ditylum_brightwellii.AAC.1